MSSNLVLVSGIPASGKSSYCEWLAQAKGFCTYNWDFAPPSNLDAEIRRMFKLPRHTAIDWGFPPSDLNIVEQLKSAGVEVWWFDGDRTVARQSFARRHQRGEHPGTPQDLDRQVAAIETHWNEIQRVFSNHVIESVSKDGYVAPERIYGLMSGDLNC